MNRKTAQANDRREDLEIFVRTVKCAESVFETARFNHPHLTGVGLAPFYQALFSQLRLQYGKRGSLASCEYFREQADRFSVDQTVVREDMRRAQVESTAAHVRDGTVRFTN